MKIVIFLYYIIFILFYIILHYFISYYFENKIKSIRRILDDFDNQIYFYDI